jgi:hypothetical protein
MPATYNAWPTVADLTTFEGFAGFDVSTRGNTYLQDAIDAAVEEWEKITLFEPFLIPSNATATLERLDPPGGRILRLPNGYVEVEEVRIGVAKGEAGDLQEEEEDYFLGPSSAPGKGKPYLEIEFTREPRGRPRSLSVKGIAGYTRNLTKDVWEAVLQGAAADLVKQTPDNKVIAEIEQDGFRQRFDEVGLMIPSYRSIEWRNCFERRARQYRRKV